MPGNYTSTHVTAHYEAQRAAKVSDEVSGDVGDEGTDDTDDLRDKQQSIDQAAREARTAYEAVQGLYEAFAGKLASVIEECLSEQGISVHSVTHRAKDAGSFQRKAAQLSTENPTLPKYRNPMDEITDKAGVRIITYFRSTLDEVSRILGEEFEIVDKITKISAEPDRLGYQSDHYLVKYSEGRTALREYRRFSGLSAEIQVRTILQHAWAEIEPLDKLKNAGIPIGDYRPPGYPEVSLRSSDLAEIVERDRDKS